MKRNYNIQKDILESLLNENIRLQEFLDKEYHLENEWRRKNVQS